LKVFLKPATELKSYPFEINAKVFTPCKTPLTFTAGNIDIDNPHIALIYTGNKFA